MKMIFFVMLAVAISAAGIFFMVNHVSSSTKKLRAIRVNPGYLYNQLKVNRRDELALFAANQVVRDAKAMSANAIFVQAYNPTFGAFYPTTHPHTEVESGLGRQDFLRALLNVSSENQIAVIAWLPVNDFKKVWEERPEWRSKKQDGSDYTPKPTQHFLSACHPEFQAWYKSFLEDLLVRYPGLRGVEGAEGHVDVNWKSEADYNVRCNQDFEKKFPSSTVGDDVWKRHRADSLTLLHQILSEVAHAQRRKSFVVQTWSADEDGNLISSEALRDRSGFDFDGILNLPVDKRPDYIAAELIWQQWRDLHGKAVFDRNWTEGAVKEFASRVNGRAIAIGHVELSTFGKVEPSLDDFSVSLTSALQKSDGAVFYDYHLAQSRDAFAVVDKIFHSDYTKYFLPTILDRN